MPPEAREIPPLEPPEILQIVEHKERIVAVREISENGREGFRVVWPPSYLRGQETHTDFYIVEEEDRYVLVSQMRTICSPSLIKDFYKTLAPNKSEILDLAHRCAMNNAEDLARQLHDRAEDQSNYKTKNK